MGILNWKHLVPHGVRIAGQPECPIDSAEPANISGCGEAEYVRYAALWQIPHRHHHPFLILLHLLGYTTKRNKSSFFFGFAASLFTAQCRLYNKKKNQSNFGFAASLFTTQCRLYNKKKNQSSFGFAASLFTTQCWQPIPQNLSYSSALRLNLYFCFTTKVPEELKSWILHAVGASMNSKFDEKRGAMGVDFGIVVKNILNTAMVGIFISIGAWFHGKPKY
jgi:hypothetical protein